VDLSTRIGGLENNLAEAFAGYRGIDDPDVFHVLEQDGQLASVFRDPGRSQCAQLFEFAVTILNLSVLQPQLGIGQVPLQFVQSRRVDTLQQCCTNKTNYLPITNNFYYKSAITNYVRCLKKLDEAQRPTELRC